MDVLILGLGNEFYGDDGIGLLAVRNLGPDIRDKVDVAESSLHGVALIDLLTGYKRAIIVDAIQTGRYPAGTIIELDALELRPVSCPSPHYTGLPEMIQIARELNLEFPDRIRILAIEINSPFTFGSDINPAIISAIKEVEERIINQLIEWEGPALISGYPRRFEQRCSVKGE